MIVAKRLARIICLALSVNHEMLHVAAKSPILFGFSELDAITRPEQMVFHTLTTALNFFN